MTLHDSISRVRPGIESTIAFFLFYERVEKRRFADVLSANNGDDR